MPASYMILWGRRVGTATVDGTDLVIDGAERETFDLTAVKAVEVNGNKVSLSGSGFEIDFVCSGSRGLRNALALQAEIETARNS